MKHLLFLFVVLAYSFSFPVCALHAENIEIDGISYKVIEKGKALEVIRPDNGGYGGDFVIPSTVTYNGETYTVTSIGEGAFPCNGLVSLTIPNTITNICANAFAYGFPYGENSSFKTVYITDLEAWCNIHFEDVWSNPLGCAHNLYIGGTLLTDLVIPNSITRLNSYAFYGCTSITSVTIPASVQHIGEYAFRKCQSISSISLADGVKEIGEHAFYNCSSLESVILPNSLESLGNFAFEQCGKLKEVVLSKSLTIIGRQTFCNCEELTSIKIPDKVFYIGRSAFSFCI